MPEEALPLPAITVADLLVLPRIPRPIPGMSIARPVARVITINAHRRLEGAGIQVRRPFPGRCRWPMRTRSSCSTTPDPR
ncbi:MAG TPA: hypothetical protein VGN22_22620, partial [Pseudonocardia sp.]